MSAGQQSVTKQLIHKVDRRIAHLQQKSNPEPPAAHNHPTTTYSSHLASVHEHVRVFRELMGWFLEDSTFPFASHWVQSLIAVDVSEREALHMLRRQAPKAKGTAAEEAELRSSNSYVQLEESIVCHLGGLFLMLQDALTQKRASKAFGGTERHGSVADIDGEDVSEEAPVKTGDDSSGAVDPKGGAAAEEVPPASVPAAKPAPQPHPNEDEDGVAEHVKIESPVPPMPGSVPSPAPVPTAVKQWYTEKKLQQEAASAREAGATAYRTVNMNIARAVCRPGSASAALAAQPSHTALETALHTHLAPAPPAPAAKVQPNLPQQQLKAAQSGAKLRRELRSAGYGQHGTVSSIRPPSAQSKPHGRSERGHLHPLATVGSRGTAVTGAVELPYGHLAGGGEFEVMDVMTPVAAAGVPSTTPSGTPATTGNKAEEEGASNPTIAMQAASGWALINDLTRYDVTRTAERPHTARAPGHRISGFVGMPSSNPQGKTPRGNSAKEAPRASPRTSTTRKKPEDHTTGDGTVGGPRGDSDFAVTWNPHTEQRWIGKVDPRIFERMKQHQQQQQQ